MVTYVNRDSVCKCCGQTLPIVIGFDGVRLSEGQKHIIEIVRKAGKNGIQSNRLFETIYANDIDGGPDSGMKSLHTRIFHINRALKQHGWRISGQHTGACHAYGRYFLLRLEGMQHAAE